MKVSFFPGCSLEGTAREYGESLSAVCDALDVQLEEVPDWSCCGATCAHATSEYLSIALPARNLSLAEKEQRDLVTPCAACFSRLKAAEKALTGGKAPDVGFPYQGNISVHHILAFLSQEVLMKKVEALIKRPLAGLKVVSYYGCLLVRPPRLTGSVHWEDPRTLDQLVSRLGGEALSWPFKTECCGGSLVLTNLDIIHRLVGRIFDMAKEAEADCIVTACPLCQGNLDTRQKEIERAKGIKYGFPIFYFTELLGLAFDLTDTRKWFRRHLVDPVPLLKEKKLM